MIDLRAREVEKYRRIWERKEYRRFSPGLEAAPRAFRHMDPDETLYDLGCGTGRAGVWFAKQGMDVVLVDFAPSAVETEALPFVEACLWEMNLPPRDWGFCADVMEHIPESHVDEVLKRISSACRAAYFQIHCENDGCGKLIGETLHLTVNPPSWWIEKLGEHFDLSGCRESMHRVELWGVSRHGE